MNLNMLKSAHCADWISLNDNSPPPKVHPLQPGVHSGGAMKRIHGVRPKSAFLTTRHNMSITKQKHNKKLYNSIVRYITWFPIG